MLRNEIYEYVNNHWVFDKNNYPVLRIFTLAKDNDLLVYFQINHVLRHLQSYSFFWTKNEYHSLSICQQEHLKVVMKTTFNLLKIAGSLHRNPNTLGENNVHKLSLINFDVLTHEIVYQLNKVCEVYEHGAELDYEKVYEILDHFFSQLNMTFQYHNKDIPWQMIPEIMKKK